MRLGTKAQLAAEHGVSKPAVTKWDRAGHIVLVDGKVDLDATNARLHAACLGKFSTAEDGSKRRKPGRDALTEEVNEPDAALSDVAARLVRSFGAEMSLEEARRVKENYLALLNQLEYDKESAKVVLVEDSARIVADAFARVRTRLLAIAPERAPVIAMLRTVAEVQDAIAEAVDEALTELSHGSRG